MFDKVSALRAAAAKPIYCGKQCSKEQNFKSILDSNPGGGHGCAQTQASTARELQDHGRTCSLPGPGDKLLLAHERSSFLPKHIEKERI